VQIGGVIVVKDDTFAGSVATNANGEAEIEFTYHLGTGKPVVQLTPESSVPVFAQIMEWTQDSDDNYTGFKIKTFGLGGGLASAVVHYNVTAKQADYETVGAITVVSEPNTTSNVGGGGTSGSSVDGSGGQQQDGSDSGDEQVVVGDAGEQEPALEGGNDSNTGEVAGEQAGVGGSETTNGGQSDSGLNGLSSGSDSDATSSGSESSTQESSSGSQTDAGSSNSET
jgi:hypothetical protein